MSLRVTVLATEIGRTNGGKGQYALSLLLHLVPILVDNGCKLTILVPKDAEVAALQAAARLVRLPVPKNSGTWRILWEQIYAPFLGCRSDVFLSLSSALPLGPLGAKRKLVVMHDIHPIQHWARPLEYSGGYSRKSLAYGVLGMKKAASSADLIVVDSRSVAAEIAAFLDVPPERIAVIPCGVDHQRFRLQDPGSIDQLRKRYDLPRDFYLVVGAAGPKKNFRLIVETYAGKHDARGLFLPVVVIGGERRPELDPATKSLIDVTGQADLFRFLGFVPDEELPAFYAASRALIFPSLHEGFGLPPLEAMACGVPVITSNCASLPEVVGDAGLLIDPHSPESLVEALLIVNQQAVRECLVEAGLKRARTFSWHRAAEQMAEKILR